MVKSKGNFLYFYIYIYFFQTFSVVCANLISSSSSSSSSSSFLFLSLFLFLFLFLLHHQPTNKKYNPHSKLTPYIIFMNTIKQINQINQKELNFKHLINHHGIMIIVIQIIYILGIFLII